MNIQETLKNGAPTILVLGYVILASALITYLLPAGAVTKISPTSLTVDYPLAFSYHSDDSEPQSQEHSQERKALVITHQYSPVQIIVFQGRNYFTVPGFQYSFDAKNAERLDAFTTSFLTRAKEDQAAPITALFSVDWWLEGKREDGSDFILDKGNFEGRLTESLTSGFQESDKISGKNRVGINFDSLNSKLVLEDKGWYVLEMKSYINYTFLAHNGRQLSGKANHTIFRAEVNYTEGRPEKINLYYPLNSITENVPVNHPMLIKLKQSVFILVSIGGFLIGTSLFIIHRAKKGRTKSRS